MPQYCLLGVGNRLRADDGSGSVLASRFSNDDWISIDAGPMPENFTGLIKKSGAKVLVMVDACDLCMPPGTFMRIDPAAFSGQGGFTTHSAPLGLFIDYLKSFVSEIIFIGIQPGYLELKEGLSPAVEEAVRRLISILEKRDFGAIPVRD